MVRPNFEEIKTFEEFNSYYWYKEELVKLCKSLKICHFGNKKDLLYIIKEYFKGHLIKNPIKKKTNSPKIIKEININMSVIECDFKFSNTFRDFYKEITGIKNFKFNADMVASVKKAKEIQDYNFTLKDLLNIYYGTYVYETFDNSSCQWNKFFQDFCKDSFNLQFTNKLKVASLLWDIVRNSTNAKVYSKDLVIQHMNLLKEYTKK